MKHEFYLFFVFTLSFLPLSGQGIDPRALENEIHHLNNEGKYDQSIIRLEKIISDPKSTAYDRFNAYLQKSFTYKRVFSYTEATNNLNLAAAEGKKSDHKEETHVRVTVEKLFILFDLQKEKETRALLQEIQKLNLNLLDEETHALYYAVLAVLEMNDGKYEQADKTLNYCITSFQRVAPSHLPNIYSKKMLLYEKMKRPEAEILQLYQTALQYANKFNSAYYRKSLYVNMEEYYLRQGKTAQAAKYRKLADDVQYDDNLALNDKSLQLAEVEKKIQNDRILHAQDQREKTQYMMIFILFGSGTLAFVFYLLLNSNHKKRLAAERQYSEMRAKLETAILNAEPQQSKNRNQNNTQSALSERQLQIITLVKEGKTNKEIGAQLFISENTVKYHLKIIYTELGIEKRNELK